VVALAAFDIRLQRWGEGATPDNRLAKKGRGIAAAAFITQAG
jgi:hypothetical protein